MPYNSDEALRTFRNNLKHTKVIMKGVHIYIAGDIHAHAA
jgi:hypothetical protein